MRKPGSSWLFGGKLNNGGMSLVEVIIAITILSIVIIPVMQALTSAAFYNVKARKRQNVMLVAESLMEVFKGYDLVAADDAPDAECLVKLFDGSSFDILDKIGADQAEDGSTSISCIEPENPQDPNGVYTFKIDNLQTEKSVYNVEITATPAGNSEVYELDNVSPEKDLVFNNNSNNNYSDDTILEKIKNHFKGNKANDFLDALKALDAYNSNHDKIDIVDKMPMPDLTLVSRETTYRAEGGSDGAKLIVDMKCTYKVEPYTYYVRKEKKTEGSGEGSTEEHGGDIDVDREDEEDVDDEDEDEFEEVTETIAGFESIDATLDVNPSEVSGGSISDGLKRVFIYYYPLYRRSDSYDEGVKDIINIKNDTGSTIECYLIKQRAEGMSDISLAIHDEKYKLELKGEEDIILYHNLDRNIVRDSNLGGGTVSISGFSPESGSVPDVNGGVGSGLKKTKVLVYTLDMRITDADTGLPVAELEGSMNEKLKNVKP